MMKRFFVILISCLWLAVPLFAQSNKLIRELESKTRCAAKADCRIGIYIEGYKERCGKPVE